MSVRQWIRHILETPQERVERERMEFMARMYQNPKKETEEAIERAIEDLRRHGFIRDDESDDLPKAA